MRKSRFSVDRAMNCPLSAPLGRRRTTCLAEGNQIGAGVRVGRLWWSIGTPIHRQGRGRGLAYLVPGPEAELAGLIDPPQKNGFSWCAAP